MTNLSEIGRHGTFYGCKEKVICCGAESAVRLKRKELGRYLQRPANTVLLHQGVRRGLLEERVHLLSRQLQGLGST